MDTILKKQKTEVWWVNKKKNELTYIGTEKICKNLCPKYILNKVWLSMKQEKFVQPNIITLTD